MRNPFTIRNNYSLIVLLLVITGESIAFAGIQRFLTDWMNYCYYILALITILWIAGIFTKMKFSIRSKILTKLLANAIAPSWLGVLFLFFFVIHIGWLTNAAMSLFMPAEPLEDIIINITICLIGMIVLILFFPDGIKEKNKRATKVFFSGISAVNFGIRNLTPLIRILQLTDDNEEKSELLILYSNYYSNPDKASLISGNINQYADYIKSGLKENKLAEFKDMFDNAIETKAKLKLIIKYCAILEFPQKTWIANNLTITFTDEETEYDKFDSCYHIMEKYVKSKDDENHELYFNLTPGTGTVGSLMTLMAIDGSRKLYYYIPENDAEKASNESEEQKASRLKGVDKNNIPLENLISQALDSII